MTTFLVLYTHYVEKKNLISISEGKEASRMYIKVIKK